jgi:hypothetical protein
MEGPGMLKGIWHSKCADISECGKFRYSLGRIRGSGPMCTFIMLNPSTADAEKDDPTLRKCMGFAERWGCGQLEVVNLFAVRATSPRVMTGAADPRRPLNKHYLDSAMKTHVHQHIGTSGIGPLVCAWGARGGFMDQDLAVMGWKDNWPGVKPMCLGITREGHPRHPLYVTYDTLLIPYCGRGWKAVRGASILESATT